MMTKRQKQSALKTLHDAASVCQSTTAVFLDAIRFAGRPTAEQLAGEQARIAIAARSGIAKMRKISPKLTKLSASLKGISLTPELRVALSDMMSAYAAFRVAEASWRAIAALHEASGLMLLPATPATP